MSKNTSLFVRLLSSLNKVMDTKQMRAFDWILSVLALIWSLSLYANDAWSIETAVLMTTLSGIALVITALDPRKLVKKYMASKIIHRRNS